MSSMNHDSAINSPLMGTEPTQIPLPPSLPSTEEPLRQTDEMLSELEQIAQQLNSEDSYTPPETECRYPEKFRLSIVMPVFNESQTIRQIIARLLALKIPKEIIVVDDGSQDGTREILQHLADLPELRVVLKPVNQGKGSAVRTGFEQATGDVVLIQDADLEYDPRDIPQLLDPILKRQSNIVYGSRFLTNRWTGSSKLHRLGNRLLTKLSNLTTGLRLTDMETCYKVFRKEVITDLSIHQDRFGFEPEITAKVARRGHKIIELPVRYSARDWSEGKKIGIKDGIETVFCILRYAFCD